jgi:hypothetical protein
VRVILEVDEAWSLMMLVAAHVVDNVEVSEKAKAAIRRWRSDYAEGSEEMNTLAEEMNEAIGNLLNEQTRRTIRRKGRYISSTDRR